MEIKEKKVMTELIFSKEEGDFLIKLLDVILEISDESGFCLDEVFQDIVGEIQIQKNKDYGKYKFDVENYYE